MSLAN